MEGIYLLQPVLSSLFFDAGLWLMQSVLYFTIFSEADVFSIENSKTMPHLLQDGGIAISQSLLLSASFRCYFLITSQ